MESTLHDKYDNLKQLLSEEHAKLFQVSTALTNMSAVITQNFSNICKKPAQIWYGSFQYFQVEKVAVLTSFSKKKKKKSPGYHFSTYAHVHTGR